MDLEEREALHPELQRRFELLDTVPERDPDAAGQGKRAFLAQAERLRQGESGSQPVPLTLPARLKGWMHDLQEQIGLTGTQRKERYAMLPTLTALILAITIIFGGGGATVFAAQDSMPDDLLYQVKLFTEDLRLNLTADDQAGFNLALGYSDERIEEFADLAAEGQPLQPEIALRYQEQLNYALQLAARFDDDSLLKAALQIRSTLEQQERVMTKLMTNAPETVDPALNQIRELIRERIRMVDSVLESPLKLRQALQQQLRFQQDEPTGASPGGQEPGSVGPGPAGEPSGEPSGNGGNNQGPGPDQSPGSSDNGSNQPDVPVQNQNGESEGPGTPGNESSGSQNSQPATSTPKKGGSGGGGGGGNGGGK